MLSRPVTAAGFAAVIWGAMLLLPAAALQLVSSDMSSCQATHCLAWVQVSYPESPQKKGGARGKAGTGGHVHHGANILLEAAAAGEGNGLQDNAAVASQGRAVGSGSSSRQGDVMGDGGSPPAALEGQAAMELGGSGGQQKGRRRVVVRKQSGPGAADVPNLGQVCELPSYTLSRVCCVCCKLSAGRDGKGRSERRKAVHYGAQ